MSNRGYFSKNLARILSVVIALACLLCGPVMAVDKTAAKTGGATGTPGRYLPMDAEVTYAEAFPDKNFLQEVLAFHGGERTGASLITEADMSAMAIETSLDLDAKNIEDLTGIEYFSGLTGLRCSNNKLTSLDVSKNTKMQGLSCANNGMTTLILPQNGPLLSIYCAGNNLTALDVSKCTSLEVLSCFHNKLTSLNVSQNTALTYLHCSDNPLATLNVASNAQLETLYCSANGLKSLDVTNNKQLTSFDCSDNGLTALNVAQNTELFLLNCNGNEIPALDVTNNTKLSFLHCGGNKLQTLDVTKNTALTEFACFTNQLETLDISQNTSLLYFFCYDNQLKALNISNATKLTSLHCGYNQLQVLDTSKNTEITSLQCPGNRLEELDLTNNTELYRLHGQNNQLTKLTLPTDGALRYVECYSNRLSALDAGGAPLLTELLCFENQLQMLDVTKNTALSVLVCDVNKLAKLDLTKNADLTVLACHDNLLTELDVSANKALASLNCQSNSIETLNVAQNTELSHLVVRYNKIKTLDLTSNSKLMTLVCSNNMLSGLDVSKNNMLAELYCGGNALTALDVSRNPALAVLDCYGNSLTELNVTNNAELAVLRCAENRLAALDVSKNAKLAQLWCPSNQLQTLNVSGTPALDDLQCFGNLLTSLDVSANKDLRYLWCMDNMLTSLDVSQNTLLESLFCYSNYMSTHESVIGWGSHPKLVINSPDDTSNGTFLFYNQQNTPIVIIRNQPPSYIVIDEGTTTASLSIDAIVAPSGNGTPSYQWYSNTAPQNEGGTPIPGATGAILAIPSNLSESGSPYYYYCVVSAQNAVGTVSIPVTVTVMDPEKPAITIYKQPYNNYTVIEGQISNFNLYVEAIVSPSGTPSYQWYSNTRDSVIGGTLIPGATNATFAIPSGLTSAGSPYYYYCVVGAAGARSIASVVSRISVSDPYKDGITITWQPATNTNVVAGNINRRLTIEAVAVPGGTPTFQWYSNTTATNSGGTPVTGATGAGFSIPAALAVGTYYYYCVVSATGMDSVTSIVATVTVNSEAPVITITTQPKSVTVTQGAITATLAIDANVAPTGFIEYRWYQRIGTNPNPVADVLVGTGTGFAIPTALTAGAYYYYCLVSSTDAENVVSDIATVTVNSPSAQTTYFDAFPDENFRQAVLALLNGLDSGTRTASSPVSETDKATMAARFELGVSYRNIKDLTGIEYFTGIENLSCDGNPLAALDVSKNTKLQNLYCQYCENLASLNVSGAVLLTNITCHSGKLTKLDVTQNTKLTKLYASANQLGSLDVSKNPELAELSCQVNELAVLDVTKNPSLTYLECWDNPLEKLDLTQNKALSTLISGCMDVEKNKLTTLDLTQNTELEWLECWGYRLGKLDLTQNTKLEKLHCGGTQLATLDLSKNIRLKELRCGDNQLKELDLSQNTELVFISCTLNQLTKLDVSKNSKLTEIHCNSNQLEKVDLTQNAALLLFSANENRLTELDVSKNLALGYLWVYTNLLTDLDVSKNTELIQLYCPENKLTKLDLSNNKKLDWIICRDNELKELDISNCAVLSRLYCQNNLMTSPDDVKGWRAPELNLTINSPSSLEYGSFLYYNQKTPTAIPVITITTQPKDTIAEVEDGVLTSGGVLTVAASVSLGGTPEYKWYRRLGASPAPATDTQVGTGTSYTVPAISTPVDYYYYCVVSAEGALSVVSDAAKVTVLEVIRDPGLQIITQPVAETTVTEGAISGSLFVVVKTYGFVTASYQWYSNTKATNSGGTPILGATTDTYKIPADLKAANSPYYYYCLVGGGIVGDEASNVATVKVLPASGTTPITSIKIGLSGGPAAAMVTVPRNSALQFGVIVNPGASGAGVVWTVSDTSFATVDSSGKVTVKNKAGMAVLTVKDPVSGLTNAIVLRIS